MSQPVAQLQPQNRIELDGPMKFGAIVPLQKQVDELLATLQGTVQMDFSGVTSVDSSALSFWLCCQRKARQLGVELKALSVPQELISIARLVGLEHELA